MVAREFFREGRNWELPDAFYRFSVKLIVKNAADQLLVLKDHTTNTWELPGGGLDHGESIRQTAEREIREELGVDLITFDDTVAFIEPGTHPDNYLTIKTYHWAVLASFDFVYERKFDSKFVSKSEFLGLAMLGDESPVQKHAKDIWPV